MSQSCGNHDFYNKNKRVLLTIHSGLTRRSGRFTMPAAKLPLPYAIRCSPTHGRGAFATRTIRKGARIVEYRGMRLARAVADARPASNPADSYHTLLLELSDGTVIDASLGGNAARWINHGCEPNCEAIEFDDGRVFIFATRTIRAGEELLYD